MVEDDSHVSLGVTTVTVRITSPKYFALDISFFSIWHLFFSKMTQLLKWEGFSALRIFLKVHSKLEFSEFMNYIRLEFKLIQKN